MPQLSVITAFFNERENLPTFRERVEAVLSDCDESWEIILVDDHSSDGSSDFARDWSTAEPDVQYIRLSRNCGSHAAFSAGMSHCRGDCAVLLAADLQDPPEVIPRLLENWRRGSNVVWAARTKREGERLSTKLLARAYYATMKRLALPEMSSQGADFLLIDRKVIDAYNGMPEKNTSFLALILWMGFRQTTIHYDKHSRHAGESKWTFAKKLKLFIDSVVSFSYVPIRLVSVLGLAVSFAAFVFTIHVIWNAFLGHPTEGYSSLMVVVLTIGGIQLLTMGILGEYLWRAFDQGRGRPWYIVEEHIASNLSLELDRDRPGPTLCYARGIRDNTISNAPPPIATPSGRYENPSVASKETEQ